MFKNRGLGTKIFCGFALVLFFVVLTAYVGYSSMINVVSRIDNSDGANLMVKIILEVRRHEKNYIIRHDDIYIKKVGDNIQKLLENASQLKKRFNDSLNKAHMDEVAQKVSIYYSAFNEYVSLDRQRSAFEKDTGTTTDQQQQLADIIKQQDMADTIMVKAARDAITVCEDASANQKSKMAEEIALANRIMILSSFFAVLLGVFLSFVMTKAITVPLNRVIDGLKDGATQVASASDQLSGTSQALAEGASEPAASIEETSSSLEEISSMTRQNSTNANHADQLMKDANKVVQKANDSMSHLILSMEEISKAGSDISNIIKTIDAIAFQTNLLALNAAVEAARAGEVGAGFAVVADEVRNLAMRSAEAAKNTALLIEGTIKKVADGSELVSKTNCAFIEVTQSTASVGALIGEISEASGEQATGIEQVNIAVAEMDKVIQQNAANAEQSASTSEEMHAQAESMLGFVENLMVLVGGKSILYQKNRNHI